MNIKLLKKVRKRFSYYRGPTGIWQIVDHLLHKTHEINGDYIRRTYKDVPSIIDESYMWRAAYLFMVERIVPNYSQRGTYNYTKRRAKRPFKMYPLRES